MTFPPQQSLRISLAPDSPFTIAPRAPAMAADGPQPGRPQQQRWAQGVARKPNRGDGPGIPFRYIVFLGKNSANLLSNGLRTKIFAFV